MAERRPRGLRGFLPVLPWLVATGVMLATLALWQSLRVRESAHIAEGVGLTLGEINGSLRSKMTHHLNGLARMAERWEFRRPTRQEWEADANALRRDLTHFYAVQWADSTLHARWVVPLHGDEPAEDFDIAFEKERRAALSQAREQRRLTLSRTVDFVHGGKGVLAYMPLFEGDEFAGFLVGAFLVHDVLDPLLNRATTGGYCVVIKDGDRQIFSRHEGSDPYREEWARQGKLELPGITWDIEIWPSAQTVANVASPLRWVALATGFLMALLLASTLHLSRAASRRAAKLGESKRRLETAQTALLRKERLATLGQLTATVSHELRNPLAAMRPSIYVIRKRSDPKDSRMQEAIDRVDRAVVRCDVTIDELLDFAHVSKLECQPTKIDQWLSEVLEEYPIPDVIDLELRCGLNGVARLIDRAQLGRAVAIVLDNACHAMLPTDASSELRENLRLTVSTRLEAGRLEIEVRDTGVGIPPENLEKVFEPLFSTKTFGVGLGLTTVKSILELYDGGVEIESRVDSGTRLILWLPGDAS